MKTRLLLIRHGSSTHKSADIIGGQKGRHRLTDDGRVEAERLASRLAAELTTRPVAIYSSVFQRAIETATILASALDHDEIVQDCGLCTWHYPDYADSLPADEFQREHAVPGGGVFRPFERDNESWSELVIRTGRALETIASRHAQQTVVIVGHTETVNSSMIVFGNLPLSPSFRTAVAPASITEWTTLGDPDAWPRPRWTLERLNDNAHNYSGVARA